MFFYDPLNELPLIDSPFTPEQKKRIAELWKGLIETIKPMKTCDMTDWKEAQQSSQLIDLSTGYGGQAYCPITHDTIAFAMAFPTIYSPLKEGENIHFYITKQRKQTDVEGDRIKLMK